MKPSESTPHSPIHAPGLRVAIVVSRFNEEITNKLLEGARQSLAASEVADHEISVIDVPGAIELPQAVLWSVESLGVDAVIALGCVIRGETSHY